MANKKSIEDIRIEDIQVSGIRLEDIPTVYLRLKRMQLGLSRTEFAALFGKSADSYRKYENGTRSPREDAYRMMKRIIQGYERELNQND